MFFGGGAGIPQRVSFQLRFSPLYFFVTLHMGDVVFCLLQDDLYPIYATICISVLLQFALYPFSLFCLLLIKKSFNLKMNKK